jgi:ribonuclease HI
VVLATIRYAEEIYGSAKNCDLMKIEATHNKGIRAALGAFCVTKTIKLLEESGLTTLEEMRKQSSIRTAIKISAKKCHPLEPIIREHTNRYVKPNFPKPLMVRAMIEAKQLNIELQKTEKSITSNIAPWEDWIDKYIDTQMMDVRNAADETKQIRFKQMLEENGTHLAVYSDGSKTDQACGFAAVSANKTLISKRLHNITSIYTAEIRAIIQALQINKYYPIPVVVYTDSLSSLMATQNRNSKETAALQLANLLHEFHGKFKLAWVPAHAGICGNETADTSAKQALHSPIDYFETISKIDLLHHVNKNLKPKKREKMKNFNRKQQVAISRVRMGYTRYTHKYIIEKNPAPICDTCNTQITVDHILRDCPKYNTERAICGIDNIFNHHHPQQQHEQQEQQQPQQNQHSIPTDEIRERIHAFLETTNLMAEI